MNNEEGLQTKLQPTQVPNISYSPILTIFLVIMNNQSLLKRVYIAQVTYFMCCAASCRVHLRKQRSFLKPKLARYFEEYPRTFGLFHDVAASAEKGTMKFSFQVQNELTSPCQSYRSQPPSHQMPFQS